MVAKIVGMVIIVLCPKRVMIMTLKLALGTLTMINQL